MKYAQGNFPAEIHRSIMTQFRKLDRTKLFGQLLEKLISFSPLDTEQLLSDYSSSSLGTAWLKGRVSQPSLISLSPFLRESLFLLLWKCARTWCPTVNGFFRSIWPGFGGQISSEAPQMILPSTSPGQVGLQSRNSCDNRITTEGFSWRKNFRSERGMKNTRKLSTNPHCSR